MRVGIQPATNNGTQWPTASLTYTISFCPSLGSCTFPSGVPSETVPSGSLGFYGSCPSSGAGICDLNNANHIFGYITSTSGDGGGVLGQMIVPATSITFSGGDTCSMPEYEGGCISFGFIVWSKHWILLLWLSDPSEYKLHMHH